MGKYVCEIEGITTAAYLDVEGLYTVYRSPYVQQEVISLPATAVIS
jgi:hypothetical protein